MEPQKSMIREFMNGGWIIPILGGASMVARLLSTNTKSSMWDHAKKIITAAICSSVAWFFLEQTDISSLTKAIIYSVIGVISPEIIAGIIKIGKKFSDNPFFFVRKFNK